MIPTAQVLEHPLDLRRRACLVDGHHDRARVPEGEVDERPFVVGLRHERDALARLDASGHEPLGEVIHLGVEVPNGDIAPTIALREPEESKVRGFSQPVLEQVCGVPARLRADYGGGLG